METETQGILIDGRPQMKKPEKKTTTTKRCKHCKRKSHILLECNRCKHKFCSYHLQDFDHECKAPAIPKDKVILVHARPSKVERL